MINVRVFLISALICWSIGQTAAASVAQTPLLLGSGNVPGSLALVPSVEYPTVVSIANTGAFSREKLYTGYFDSLKCYKYIGKTTGKKEDITNNDRFEPVSKISLIGRCGSEEFHGNFLNWAFTPTIDPFRAALTGGNRFIDEPKLTVLQKARNPQSDGNRGSGDLKETAAVTPYGQAIDSITLGQKQHSAEIKLGRETKTYMIRVKVCDPRFLEANCQPYPNGGYKPEGLIQQYARELRYSAFGYLNDSSNNPYRKGGVLRAEQKYVGPKKPVFGGVGEEANPQAEWREDTGQLIQHPDIYANEGKSSWSDYGNSGVINYINKFGEWGTHSLKSYDPVSELYYTAIRYFKNQGNVADYTAKRGSEERQADRFPVIESKWSDPINYSCQKNIILGIGDVNTHQDRNLPAKGDNLPLNDYTNKILRAEGSPKTAEQEFTGRNNSAYIAGLAYYANTTNIRPNQNLGDQRISTYWIDVREGQKLETSIKNQYWLATKYGGFTVPKDFDPLKDSIKENPWWTDGDKLENGNLRPRTFYVASDANLMVRSLKEAFANIVQSLRSTTTSLAANSTSYTEGTIAYQTLLSTDRWSGDIIAKDIVTNVKSWSAAEELDKVKYDDRKIFTFDGKGKPFNTASLSAGYKKSLSDSANIDLIVKYLRGDRANERSGKNLEGIFRQRDSVLGDITNSDPQYMQHQNFGYAQITGGLFHSSDVGQKYIEYRSSTPYKSKPGILAVGANDGMLHIFNAKNGEELFAYIPQSVVPKLEQLVKHEYSHLYYVDGTPRIGDAYINNEWKTILIGSTGAGGNSIFALDVSNPEKMDAGSVLWEFNGDDQDKLGLTIAQPTLVPLNNGKFGVVISSGYEREANAKNYIWILDAADGKVIKKFELNTSGDLGSVLAVDLSNNKTADRLYVADTVGKVWRIDIADSKVDKWQIPASLKGKELFSAVDPKGRPQPITAPLDAAYTQDKRLMLLVGTGSYYKMNDGVIGEDPIINSLYGLVDEGKPILKSGLIQQEILQESMINEMSVRVVTDIPMKPDSNGWYLDLLWSEARGGNGAEGERIIARPTLGGNRVTFTSLIPSSDPCLAGGRSWIMSLDLATGSRLNYSFFDLNKDGIIDSNDYVVLKDKDGNELKDSNGNVIRVPSSGFSNPNSGVIKKPLVLDARDSGKRYLCYASSEGAKSEVGVDANCIEILGGVNSSNRLSWHEEN